MLEVRRSPARVTWWVLCNGTLIQTTDTRKQAEAVCIDMASKYNLEFNSTKSARVA